ncbi:ATP-dependent helicase [Flavobacterium sp. F-65]|uniref:DNA 3'-5' helicase n=1 Tax=Flavobacterium pisciphilum TaxID=2893755 RepID=A0ABS8MPT3_9FLAO|nr:ATP-dependent helicase [Flavobacterium sp. F-65]MCC9070756.1 ATP-dependent helicase [Flavobacterium sp. F-65]
MEPTEQQKIIIDYDGNSVVIAAPGSGKTFVVSQKIKRNLVHLKNHEGIIAISYTNKASNELKNRSLSNGEDPKSSFFGTIDKFNISEILIPFGKLMFGIPRNEIKIIKGSSLEDFEVKDLEWIDRNISIEELSEARSDILISFFLQGIILIETIGLLSNYILNNSLACQKYLKSKYRYIYIDEYQDSGNNQHEIFLKINNLGIRGIAVGDLNQSIFAFSFKDSKFLDELSKNENFKYFKLDKNHRCHSSIINYSNYLLNSKTELIPDVESKVFSQKINGDESSIAKYIDENIIKLKKIFSLDRNNQIAVLVRNGRTANIIRDTLKTENRFFITNELDSNLNIWSIIFSKLLHYIFHKEYTFIDVIEVFTTYNRFCKSDLLKLKNCKKQIQELTSKDKINFKYLRNVFVEIAEIISPSLKNQESIDLLEKTLNNSEELNSYKPANENEINIMTLHKSKGLEFELVIHLDLYEWILPSKKPRQNNDFDNPVYPNYIQDLNLHYVGLTRAIKACILLNSTQRTNHEYQLKKACDSEFMSINGIEELRWKSKK